MDDLFKNRKIATKKILWNRIASQMNDEGYNVSAIQVENKYKSLERAYKNMISNNKKTGRGCISCPYEAELTDLLGSKHNIEPLVLSGRQGLILKKNTTTNISLSVDDNSDNSNDPVQLTVTPNTIQSYTEVTTRNNAIATTNNNSNQISVKKSGRKEMGPTARFLDSCQKSMEILTSNIQKEKASKDELYQQMLAEYSKMRNAYEECVTQLITANKLREEKNRLLKEIFLDFSKEKE